MTAVITPRALGALLGALLITSLACSGAPPKTTASPSLAPQVEAEERQQHPVEEDRRAGAGPGLLAREPGEHEHEAGHGHVDEFAAVLGLEAHGVPGVST